MKKIIWVTQSSNTIYLDLFKAMKRDHPDLEFIMALNYKYRNLKEFKKKGLNFKIVFFKEFENLTKLIKTPYSLIRYFNPKQKYEKFSLFFYYLNGLNKFLKNEKPDCVISNILYQPYTWQVARYCKKTHTPFILQTQVKSFPNQFKTRIIEKLFLRACKSMFNQANLIQCWTFEGVKFGRINFPINNKLKIKFLPPGINTKYFSKVKIEREEDEILKLLMVARFLPYKRHIDLLKAIKFIKENHNLKCYLTILGTGFMENKIRNTVENYNLQENIRFINHIPYYEMNDLYSSHDILIHPSYNEAVGMVVPEAMACGLPVIVSDTSGSASYVINGKNGYIFKTLNYKDLAKKIILLKDKTKREEFSIFAEKWIKRNYDINIIAKNFFRDIEKSYSIYQNQKK